MEVFILKRNRTDRRSDYEKKTKELKNLQIFDTIVRLGRRSTGGVDERED